MVIGKCIICGSGKSVTIHHLRNIHANTKRKPKANGEVHLCRDCHDEIEAAKVYINSMKSLKAAYKRGYEKGIKESPLFKEITFGADDLGGEYGN